MTAAVGIVMDTNTCNQKIYGARQVPMGPKNTANSSDFHRDDILSLDISQDRKMIVTGQVGNTPSIHVWNAEDC
jgi:hypothetical protein